MRLSRGGPTIAWRVLAPQMLADELDLTPNGTDILCFRLHFVVLCITVLIVLTSVRS